MQKRNYQKELDKIIEENERAGVRPRLLVHSCCAPCSSYVMEYLSRHFDLTMYFYNPNMDSKEEYEKRAAELRRLIGELNAEAASAAAGNADGAKAPAAAGGPVSHGVPSPISCVIADYDPESFEEIAKGHEDDPERGARCLKCYELRLRKTAEFMLHWNENVPFDYFATTLTLSPLKNAEALNSIGEQLAEQYGLKCLASDFKKKNGYKRSIELSKEHGLYRQNYCGCRFSKEA
ncbi:MAG: epoxyqueuosine reductase QueH, partial [Eubacteriales bacterium]|nr:epoxyqueuosine reductase QueH [Eubacteriales bacterium]